MRRAGILVYSSAHRNRIDNPWPPHSGDAELITYDRYVSGPYQHWRDYYDIRPAADGESQ